MRQPLVSTVGLKVRRQPNAMRDEEMLMCTLLCLPQGSGCAPTAWDGGGQSASGTAQGGWMYRSIQLDGIHPKELRVMDRFS